MTRALWIGRLMWMCAGAATGVACSSGPALPPELGDTPGVDSGTFSPIDTIPTSSTSYELRVGATVPVSPGVRVGYALTAPQAMAYQFRWTGDAAVTGDGYQNFYGSIWTTGHFTSLTPGCTNQACPLEAGDYVSAITQVDGGERIDWDTDASTGWDGFSFTTDTEPVYFDVLIDGSRHPELFVYPDRTTGQPATPAVSPFGMSSM
jgi:hypothetical protein